MKRERLNILIILTVGFTAINLMAQQQPICSHYMFNQYSLNPGAAGSSERVNTVIIVRDQWKGIDGAPRSIFFSVNAPFRLFKTQSAFGVDVVGDEAGFQTDAGMKAGYTIRFNAGTGKLGIGVRAGFIYPTLEIGSEGWKFGEGNNEFQSTTDPNIPSSGFKNEFVFDMDFGIYYNTDELYVGLSSIRINQPEFKPKRTESTSLYEYVRHYNFITGYNLYLPNPSFEISPSFIVRSDGKIMTFDINTLLTYNKKIWGGLSYRYDETSYGIAFFGIELIKDLRISYAYEIPSQNIIKYTQQTHEILATYNFTITKEKTTQRYKSIRYL